MGCCHSMRPPLVAAALPVLHDMCGYQHRFCNQVDAFLCFCAASCAYLCAATADNCSFESGLMVLRCDCDITCMQMMSGMTRSSCPGLHCQPP